MSKVILRDQYAKYKYWDVLSLWRGTFNNLYFVTNDRLNNKSQIIAGIAYACSRGLIVRKFLKSDLAKFITFLRIYGSTVMYVYRT
ncbi:hypothetical protein Hanom_Chr10g00947121 [Helianthus anomalus]